MKAVISLCLMVTFFYIVSCCPEETHYLKDGKCCKKCGQGKRMLIDDNCDDPRCQDCQDGEYQSSYTKETKCKRQPSCDTNLNFMPQLNNLDKTQRSDCKCKEGYHCSQDDGCSICRRHTICRPGQKVVKKGSPVSDTICEACREGTFSTKDSADECREWTKCDVEDTPGNLTSDRTCGGKPVYRTAIVVGACLVPVFIALVVFVYLYIKRGKSKFCKLHQTNDVEGEFKIPQQPLYQQPEEEDEGNHEPLSPTLSNMTDNGNVVVQEHGKDAVFPCHESTSSSYL